MIRSAASRLAVILAGLAVVSVVQFPAYATQAGPGRGGRGGPPGPPPSPQAGAAIDLTGYWVSIVNEDWRWRMVTAPKGDFPGIPLNAEGQALARSWDPATDGSCKAFGAAALMRMPTRVHITWENDHALKLETDNGQQIRRLDFNRSAPTGEKSLQGFSVAEWVRTTGRGAGFFGTALGPPPPGGSLKVVTTNLSGGWLRRNGVPYSDKTIVTEYFDRFPVPNGGEWLAVTTIVEDSTYLFNRFVTSSHFRREADASKWAPRACKTL